MLPPPQPGQTCPFCLRPLEQPMAATPRGWAHGGCAPRVAASPAWNTPKIVAVVVAGLLGLVVLLALATPRKKAEAPTEKQGAAGHVYTPPPSPPPRAAPAPNQNQGQQRAARPAAAPKPTPAPPPTSKPSASQRPRTIAPVRR